jgi:hypothetical protein
MSGIRIVFTTVLASLREATIITKVEKDVEKVTEEIVSRRGSDQHRSSYGEIKKMSKIESLRSDITSSSVNRP